MRGAKSLAVISEEQQTLSDRIAIVVRLGAAALLVALAAAEGRASAMIANAVVLAVFCGISFAYVLVFRRKSSAARLFIPALVVDAVGMTVMALFALARTSIVPSLADLFILEAFCLSVVILASFRMSLRECVLAVGAAVLTPAVAVVYAIFRFPGDNSARPAGGAPAQRPRGVPRGALLPPLFIGIEGQCRSRRACFVPAAGCR